MVNSFTSVGSNKTLWLTPDTAASSSTVTSFPNFAGSEKFGKLGEGEVVRLAFCRSSPKPVNPMARDI